MSSLESDFSYVEVLPRLPLKSLLCLKCVSNTLKASISSPEFVQLYLRRQLHHPDTSNLLVLPGDSRIHCCYLDSPPRLPAATTFARNVQSETYVLSSSNGLLCLFDKFMGYSQLILLNPSTRICRGIRIPSDNAQVINYGLGFDLENHDYKITMVYDQYSPTAVNTRTTKVYSLNSNSWRMVDDARLPEDSMEGSFGGALINNHLLHWMFWSSPLRRRRIGCFDVCREEWVDDVLLPPYYYGPMHTNYLLDIGVLDGCLFSSFENTVNHSFDVWVMKEYGVQDSWRKLLSIPVSNNLSGGVVPIVFGTGSAVVLIRQRHRARLFWYNLLDNGLTEVVAEQAPNFSYFQAYTCIKSLVTIPGGVPYEERY